MRTTLLAVAVVSLVVVTQAAASATATRTPISATLVGDSVSASITYVSAARDKLRHGLSVRLDVKVCRRLVQPSCTFQGSTPTTGLQAVRSYGRALGRVLIVDVGYNEGSQGYGDGIDRVMRAALADGVSGVVWVTLREKTRNAVIYQRTNLQIRKASGRWPQLLVADWDRHSAGKPWFGADGLHLTGKGAIALAAFLRSYVFRAASPRG